MADPGWVYVMTYVKGYQWYYNISCTSGDPETCLEEIQREERARECDQTIVIELYGFAHADHMHEAESAAQAAVSGFVTKDTERKEPTDWFFCKSYNYADTILSKIEEACIGPVYKMNKLSYGNSWYFMKDENLDKDQVSEIAARAVETANSHCPTYYVYIMSVVKDSITHYTIGSTESDPNECLEKIRREENNDDIKLVCFMHAKDKDRVLSAIEKAIERDGFVKRSAREWYVNK